MSWEQKLEQLRLDFDHSFAEEPRTAPATHDDLLVLSCGGELFAVRLAEISALVTQKKVTALPGSVPGMLGIAGFRGSTVPVYDLGALLGHGPESGRAWLLLTAATPRIALAFEAFHGHLRVPRAEFVSDSTRRFVQGFVPQDGAMRPVLQLDSILGTIKARVQPQKES